MAKPFVVRRRVEFVDTDMAGIAHFSNFFRWMESAEQEFLRSRGLTVAWAHRGRQFGFPRVAAACDYLKPVKFEEVLEIAVEVERIGNKSVTYLFTFSRAGDVVARGKLITVCSQESESEESFESIEIPDEIRQKLAGR
jgi:YbgC/YbaW family acyl-CoA thioester hydrolase